MVLVVGLAAVTLTLGATTALSLAPKRELRAARGLTLPLLWVSPSLAVLSVLQV